MERRMKVIRVATLAVALCAGVTSVSAAQAPDQQGERPGRGMGGRILDGITLTDAQKAQQKVIREKYAPQMMQVRKTAETTGTPPDEAKMADLRAAQMAELRAILTGEQQVIFDRNVAELKARMADRKG
jgi:Spy/CpxP family protein refolding chaperone